MLETLTASSLADEGNPVLFFVCKFLFFEQYAALHQDVDEVKFVDYMGLWGDDFLEGLADQSGSVLLAINVVDDRAFEEIVQVSEVMQSECIAVSRDSMPPQKTKTLGEVLGECQFLAAGSGIT